MPAGKGLQVRNDFRSQNVKKVIRFSCFFDDINANHSACAQCYKSISLLNAKFLFQSDVFPGLNIQFFYIAFFYFLLTHPETRNIITIIIIIIEVAISAANWALRKSFCCPAILPIRFLVNWWFLRILQKGCHT